MKCEKCGNDLNINNQCSNCNSYVNTEEIITKIIVEPENKEEVLITPSLETPVVENKKEKNIKYFIMLGVILLVIICLIIAIVVSNNKVDNATIKTIVELKKNDELKFTINKKDYYLGDKISKLLEDGFTIDKSNINQNIVKADSIVLKTFYVKGIPYFMGALYCPESNDCTYEDSVLIKANFYKESKVKVYEDISFSSSKNKALHIPVFLKTY